MRVSSPLVESLRRASPALVLAALLAMVLAGVTEFKGRWLLPLLCVLPLAAFAARPELQRTHALGATPAPS